MTQAYIPSFGCKPGDFKAPPFSFELYLISLESAGPPVWQANSPKFSSFNDAIHTSLRLIAPKLFAAARHRPSLALSGLLFV